MDWFALKIAMNRLKMEGNGLTVFCGISQGVGSLSVTLHPLIDLLGSFLGVQNGPRKTALCIIKKGGSYRSRGTRRWWRSRGIFGMKSSTSTWRMDGFSTKCPHWAGWLRIGVTLTNMMRAMILQTGRNGPAHGGSGGRARTTHFTAAIQKCEFRVLKTHCF
jgi:hypothetical protein